MSKNSDEIRSDIARTRGEMREEVDAIVDRVSPTNIAHRQGEKIKGSFNRAKEAVMGASETTGEQTQQMVEDVRAEARRAPHRVAEQTKGNPLAAGLIAFGAGLLVSSLIPGSERESELVEQLKEKAEPLTHELGETAKEISEDMKEPLRSAGEELKDSAREAVEHVKHEATEQAEDLQSHAQQKAEEFKDERRS